MNKILNLSKLRENKKQLSVLGIAHVGLFGSVARNEADEHSDIDIAVQLDPEKLKTMNIYSFCKLQGYIGSLFDKKVDLIDRDWAAPTVQKQIDASIIDAF
jgi:predicted nucleotidyltransferase